MRRETSRPLRAAESYARFSRRAFLAAAPGSLLWATGCKDSREDSAADGGSIDAFPAAVDGETVDACAPLLNLFGAYNFTIDKLSPSEQLQLLRGMGYRGITFDWTGTEAFTAFADDPLVVGGDMTIAAALLTLDTIAPVDAPFWVSVFERLKATGTRPWLLLSGTKNPQQNAARVEALSKIATSVSDIPIVLYPHWTYGIETAEESLEVLRLLNTGNVRTSLHLCHELKAGNVGRLKQVIERSAAYLDLVSVNGAYVLDTDREMWSRTILPLDEGDLNVADEYLQPLAAAGYKGPILLHTFGITQPPATHYRRSIDSFNAVAGRCNVNAHE